MRGVFACSTPPINSRLKSQSPTQVQSRRPVGVETHERLTLELYEHSIQLAGSQSQPVVRQCYGGPAPFGLGLGIVQHLESLAWLQPLPDPREQQRRERAQQRHELRNLQRNFSAPLDHLDEQAQEQVKEGRLRLLLSKFWGLMHEKDRPWHYDTIVHLCCRLPKPARRLYRRLKASTLQRILARRAQVEKGLLECLPAIENEVRRMTQWEYQVGAMTQWEYQVLELGRVVPQPSLEQSLDSLLQLQSQLAVLQAALQLQRKQAWQLGDKEYTQLYGSQLQELLQQCRQVCRDMQRSQLPYIVEVSGVNSEHEERSMRRGGMRGQGQGQGRLGQEVPGRERLLAITRIGPMPAKLRVPSSGHIDWRYPPRDSLGAQGQ